MYKFIKIKNPDNHFDNTNIEMEVDADTLPDLFEEFKHFLLACGFVVKGDIDEIENDND